MREILFRGKRTDTGKWVEGDLLHNRIDGQENERRLGDIYFTQGEEIHGTAVYNVIPETIGQYTGLTDRNGKRIFEGDIVKFGDILGIINYGTGCYCVKTNKPDWRARNNPAIDIVINEYPNEIEIIGNIHDNPDLLN